MYTARELVGFALRDLGSELGYSISELELCCNSSEPFDLLLKRIGIIFGGPGGLGGKAGTLVLDVELKLGARFMLTEYKVPLGGICGARSMEDEEDKLVSSQSS